MDSDVIIKGDVLEFSDFFLKDYPVGAVFSETIGEDAFLNKAGDDMFNAGVLVINNRFWIENDVMGELLRVARERRSELVNNDQDVLNHVFRNNWVKIPLSWNVRVGSVKNNFFLNLFNKQKFVEPINIIHYTTHLKPWLFKSTCPLKNEYWYYLKLTPWKDYECPDMNFKGFVSKFYYYFLNGLI